MIFMDGSSMEQKAEDKEDAAIFASAKKVMSNPTEKHLRGQADPSTIVERVLEAGEVS